MQQWLLLNASIQSQSKPACSLDVSEKALLLFVSSTVPPSCDRCALPHVLTLPHPSAQARQTFSSSLKRFHIHHQDTVLLPDSRLRLKSELLDFYAVINPCRRGNSSCCYNSQANFHRSVNNT